MSAKIIVTGSNGQLGSELKDLSAQFPQFEFVFFTRAEWPVNDKEAGQKIFEEHRPAFLINCAAYTAVDQAESEAETASEINGNAVGHMAALSRQWNTKFIHVSTDYVFNGAKEQPLREDDATDPVNAYGASKLLGEHLAMKNNQDSVVIRTSWVYSIYGKNFVKTMMRLMKEKESINVVNDQFGSPTYAADLAVAIMQIITSPQWVPGIYHFSNEGVIAWYDFATEIKSLIGASCQVNSIPTEQFPTPARRPRFSVLDKTKIINTYHIQPQEWKASLAACIARLKKA